MSFPRSIMRAALSLVVPCAVLFACSSSSTTATTTERLCTPGAYVFCLCQTGDNGTKLCHDDGQSFDQCLLPGDAPCPGGELSDGGATMTTDGGATIPDSGGESPVASCPGKATGVDPNKPLTIQGNTTGGKDNGAGKPGPCAVGLQSPDNVYQLIPTAKGQLAITVKGDGSFDPTLYLRSMCSDAQTELACSETTGAGGTETFTINAVPGRNYFLYVDGKTGSAGAYTLTLSLKPGSFCGDGTVDTGEACDDGNNVDNDGCSPDCKAIHGDTSPVPAGAGCSGEVVHVWGGATSPTVIATGTTTTYPNSWKDTDSGCKKTTNVNNAADHEYAVTVHKSGTLTVSTQNAAFNVELLARTVCTDPLTTGLTMCANDNNTNSAPFDETMSFAVTSGSTYFVAVDGASVSAKGDYQLTFSLP